jgi:hypothetical protein
LKPILFSYLISSYCFPRRRTAFERKG